MDSRNDRAQGYDHDRVANNSYVLSNGWRLWLIAYTRRSAYDFMNRLNAAVTARLQVLANVAPAVLPAVATGATHDNSGELLIVDADRRRPRAAAVRCLGAPAASAGTALAFYALGNKQAMSLDTLQHWPFRYLLRCQARMDLDAPLSTLPEFTLYYVSCSHVNKKKNEFSNDLLSYWTVDVLD
eukprot:SAG11_NODE_3909_length_2151_cov_1.102190_2_plen_184_part_00